jgi:hypothetical protein
MTKQRCSTKPVFFYVQLWFHGAKAAAGNAHDTRFLASKLGIDFLCKAPAGKRVIAISAMRLGQAWVSGMCKGSSPP